MLKIAPLSIAASGLRDVFGTRNTSDCLMVNHYFLKVWGVLRCSRRLLWSSKEFKSGAYEGTIK